VHFADRAYRPSGCLNVQHRQWLLMPVLVWLLLALCNVGKQHVYNNGQLHWPNGRFGVCGDPWDSNKPLEKAGRVTGRQLRQQHISPPAETTATRRILAVRKAAYGAPYAG
jgi:hypothetical protein